MIYLTLILALWVANVLYLQGEDKKAKEQLKALFACTEAVLLLVWLRVDVIWAFWVHWILKDAFINYYLGKRGLEIFTYNGNYKGDYLSTLLRELYNIETKLTLLIISLIIYNLI